MPPRGTSGAPVFDPSSDIRSISGFFEDLEFCFDLASVQDHRAKKDHAVRYAPDSEKNIWRSLPQFSDTPAGADPALYTFMAFKDAVLAEYIGVGGKTLFSLSDLEMLVNMTARTGIYSIKAFNDYSRKFRDIATVLVSGHYLREDDRDEMFLRGLQQPFQDKVVERLRIVHANIMWPRQKFSVIQVSAAVQHILEAAIPSSFATNQPFASHTGLAASTSTTASTAPPIKSELADMTEALKAMTTAFMQLQRQQLNPSAPTALGPAARQLPPHMSAPMNLAAPTTALRTCHYCGDPAHTIPRCPQVDTDILAGIIKRNEQNRVVLPSGSFVPAAIQGNTLRERVQEYHRIYPEARANAAVPQLFFEPRNAQRNAVQEAADQSRARTDRAQRRGVRFKEPLPSAADASSSQVEGANTEATDMSTGTPEPATQPVGERNRFELPSVAVQPSSSNSAAASQTAAPLQATGNTAPSKLPEHPYAGVRDATYAPPHQRNFGLPSPRPGALPKKSDPAYRSQAPVCDPRHAANVFKRSLELPITLSQEELLAIAPDVRTQMRETCSSRRIPTTTEPVLTHDTDIYGALPFTDDIPPAPSTSRATESLLSSMPTAFERTVAGATPPPGSFVLPDPYEQYLRDLPPGQDPVPFRVSLESASVRAIEGLFADDTHVSCIHDSGSAIISMSEGLCHSLGLDYDPRVRLEMQSANGEVDMSLGLARNVPVRFGSIVAYLQIHVIRSPAYDVLLGRPFDILTSSVVRTNSDGSQTVTLHDPNSDIVTTIPTLPRIEPQFSRSARSSRSSGFRVDSRN
ncbi:hypothetical protein LXA43DRAFT_901298 [Ganoderma leucocontextum]|nr:hypothetical protein LXA43DRAFT_901298 [Ganoderma leucocontextum]